MYAHIPCCLKVEVEVVPDDFHAIRVIHHSQMSVYLNVIDDFKLFFQAVWCREIPLDAFVAPQNDEEILYPCQKLSAPVP